MQSSCNFTVDRARINGIYICINNKGLTVFLAPLYVYLPRRVCAMLGMLLYVRIP
jgi:hypothetical protein